MGRYRIEMSPAASRTLNTVSAGLRQDVTQLLQGIAELAVTYPLAAPLWARLGRVDGNTVAILLSGHVVRLTIEQPTRTIRLVGIDGQRSGGARRTRGGGRRTLRGSVVASALARRRPPTRAVELQS